MKFNNLRRPLFGRLVFTILSILLAVNCRPRAGTSSEVRDVQNVSVVNKIEISKANSYQYVNVQTDETRTRQIITLKSADAGMVKLEISLDNFDFDASKQDPTLEITGPNSPILASKFVPKKPNAGRNGAYGAAIYINVIPNQDYTVAFDYSQGNFIGSVLFDLIETIVPDNANPPIISTNAHFSGVLPFKNPEPGRPWLVAVLQRVGAGGLHQVEVDIQTIEINELFPYDKYATIPAVAGRVVPGAPPYVPVVTFDPTGLKISTPIPAISANNFQANLNYLLTNSNAANIPLMINVISPTGGTTLADGKFVSIEMRVGTVTESQNARNSMGLNTLAFGQKVKDTAYLGNEPLGFELRIPSNPLTHDNVTPVDVQLQTAISVYRALNVSTEPLAKDIEFNLASIPVQHSRISLVSDSEYNAKMGFEQLAPRSEKFVGTFLLGNPLAGGLQPSDFVIAETSMAMSTLLLPPDASAGRPLTANNAVITESTITTLPPANYAVRPNYQPIPMDKSAILAAMEEIRLHFHETLPAGSKRDSTNTIDYGTIEACLGNTAPHWSDITLHYYCQHGQARSCYTTCVRGAGTQPNARQNCFDSCLNSDDNDWRWIKANEFSVPGHTAKVKQTDVFRYIMFSETFAFDPTEQQEVINKFYQVGDVNDPSACSARRPRRAIDPVDKNQCLPSKEIPLAPAGR